VTIARLNSMTKASETLNISLSALSNQIKMLEEELNLSLLIRKPRGVELSEQGKILYQNALDVLESANEMKVKALTLQEEVIGRMTLGLNTDPQFLKINTLNKEINKILPGISVFYEASQSVTTASLLRHRKIDMGFIYGNIEDVDIYTEILGEINILIVVPNSLLSDIENAGWKKLSELPWVWGSDECPFHREVGKKSKGFMPPENVIQASDEPVMIELVKAGAGACILREDHAAELVEQGVATVWDKDKLTLPVCVAMLKKRVNEPDISSMTTVIKNVFT